MSTKNDRRTQLLAETFHDNWSAGPAGDLARQGAQAARRHRGRRQILLVAGAAIVAAAAVVARRPMAPSPLARPSAAAPAYETISDADLIANLRDRPVLVLPHENGGRQIVVLGDAAGD